MNIYLLLVVAKKALQAVSEGFCGPKLVARGRHVAHRYLSTHTVSVLFY